MRRTLVIIALAALAAGCASLGKPQASPEALAGQAFAGRACAGCHAVGPHGASPNPHSPPFRTLAGLLPGAQLDAQLAINAQHGHGEMPPIYMTPDEIRGVAAYIRSISRSEPGPKGRSAT
jgi:mono/diheme cytochrome c family protein